MVNLLFGAHRRASCFLVRFVVLVLCLMPFLASAQDVASITMSPNNVVSGGTTTATITMESVVPVGPGVQVSLHTSHSYIQFAQNTVTVFGQTKTATVAITTSPIGYTTTATITATANGVSVNGYLTLTPAPATISVFPQPTVMGGQPIGVTVFLSAPAPAGGTTVALSCDHPGVVPPVTATVQQGDNQGTFHMPTLAVDININVVVRATVTGMTVPATATIGLRPIPLQSVTMAPNNVVGGNGVTGTVSLAYPAPAGGVVGKSLQ